MTLLITRVVWVGYQLKAMPRSLSSPPLFSGTLRYAFHWLVGRPWLAAGFGAAGGPAAFYAGHRLGAVQFHPTTGLSLAVLAVVWAALFPLLVHLSTVLGGPERGAYRRFM